MLQLPVRVCVFVCRGGPCGKRSRRFTRCAVILQSSVGRAGVPGVLSCGPLTRAPTLAEGIVFFISILVFVVYSTWVNDVHGQWLQVKRAARDRVVWVCSVVVVC